MATAIIVNIYYTILGLHTKNQLYYFNSGLSFVRPFTKYPNYACLAAMVDNSTEEITNFERDFGGVGVRGSVPPENN